MIDELGAAQATIRELQAEIEETNGGLVALTLELEQRVDARTAELRAAQEELQRTNSELLQLTLELEERVFQRTRELEQKNEAIQTMSQQLWQTAKLATMGELAASIAHELNNPLARVSLHTEGLLARTPAGDAARPGLEVIEQETERMAELVANLLQFSRRSLHQISTLDVRDEVRRTLDLIRHHLRNRAIRVVLDLGEETPTIHADRQQLRQVLLNLFTNASDAMPEGGELSVSVSAEGEGVAIRISDTGPGISPELLERVKEPFFTTKPEGKGTGLGLAICQRIIHEHGGGFVLESQPDRGTTARIVLPAAARPRPAAEGAVS